MSDRRIIYSCNIETTGLCDKSCQILELAIIAFDLDLPCEPLVNMKRFHCYIEHERYKGEALALSMHPVILRRIATRAEPYNYYGFAEVTTFLREWVDEVQGLNGQGQADMTFAGKNFGRFDSRFLNRLPNWQVDIKESHRSFDPRNLYFDSSLDRKLPDMKICLERAAMRCTLRTGVDQGFGLLDTKHDAMGNAELVIKLLRAAWDIDEDQPKREWID